LFQTEDLPIVEREHLNNGLVEAGREELHKLGHMKSACNLVNHYLPVDMHSILLAQFDFRLLDEYIEKIREEDAARLSLKPTKKTKANGTESAKRKAANQISRGADKLKKADTSRMNKLSSFFQKATK